MQAALPLNLEYGLADVPTCQSVSSVPSAPGAASGPPGSGSRAASSALHLDPWLLLEGGAEAGSTAAAAAAGTAAPAARPVPPWLDGAVKRRRRGLSYWPAPHSTAGPPVSIEEQLQERGEDRFWFLGLKPEQQAAA